MEQGEPEPETSVGNNVAQQNIPQPPLGRRDKNWTAGGRAGGKTGGRGPARLIFMERKTHNAGGCRHSC